LEETAIEIEQWCELLITKHRETFEAFSCFSLVNTQLAKNRLFYHPRDRKYVPKKRKMGGGLFISYCKTLFMGFFAAMDGCIFRFMWLAGYFFFHALANSAVIYLSEGSFVAGNSKSTNTQQYVGTGRT